MLQIIGWLGCLYLVVKGLEIGSSSAFLDAEGKAKGFATLACMLALGGAFVFAIWLYEQGAQADETRKSDELSASILSQCIQLAKTPEDMARCGK